MAHNIIIASIGYKRPEYLRQSLDAIMEMDNMNAPIRIFLDLLPDNTLHQEVYDLAKSYSPHVLFPIEKQGCNGTIKNALAHCFSVGADAVLVVEDDIILSRGGLNYVKWALENYGDNTLIRNITLWESLCPTPDENSVEMQKRKFTCWGWVALKREWPEMEKAWTTDRLDTHKGSWDVVMEAHLGSRYELAPSVSLARNIGEKDGTHRGAAMPVRQSDCINADYYVAPIKKTVYVILGRFGDIYMTCKAIREPSIVCCSKRFVEVMDLFPQHEVVTIDNDILDPVKAASFCTAKYPTHEVIVCQIDQQPTSLCKPFRSYQAYQEYHASL